jgi:catechol 2,3-dioxygenase-like lactoylglutathione lyase family enzyme
VNFAVERIDHVEVFVRDLEASVRWYERVLGLREVSRWDPAPVMIGAGDTMLALFKAADDAAPSPPASVRSPRRWRLVAWRVAADAFDDALAHLQAEHVPFEGPVDHSISHSVYFNDPDGHPLEITCYPG